MFDDKNIYVTAKLYESVPESQWVANEIRRDTNQMRQNDIFGALFIDTFYDHRNGFHFYTNALGGFTDQPSPMKATERRTGIRCGTRVRTLRMAAGSPDGDPFKSLRYVSGTNMTWCSSGAARFVTQNECWSVTLAALPAAGGGPNSIFGCRAWRRSSVSTRRRRARTSISSRM